MKVEEINSTKETTLSDLLKTEFYQAITSGKINGIQDYLKMNVTDPLKFMRIVQLQPLLMQTTSAL